MTRIKQFLLKDNLAFGVILALVISISIYALFSLAAQLFPEAFSIRFLRKQVIVLISIFANLFPFRTYMAGLKYEKTGKGILVSMFVMMALYFIFIHGEHT